MRMASPTSASRSLSVSLLARARIFAAMTVPGVVATCEDFAFFGLLRSRECIRRVGASTVGRRKMTRANTAGGA